MGFYITISVNLYLDRKTGKLYYYDNEFEKVYNISDIKVPEEYKRFLSEKGSHYPLYMRNDNCFDFVKDVYACFPSWEEIKENLTDNDEWTKQDHCLFEQAIKWFAEQNIQFIINFG